MTMHPGLRSVACVAAALLAACASPNLDAVRDFAGETRKISVAFRPFLAGAVTQCEQKFVARRVYTSERPIAQFDARKVLEEAAAVCKPVAAKNAIAQALSVTLALYARQLGAIAGEAVDASLDDDFDPAATQLKSFDEFPKAQVDAANAFFKFLGQAALGRQQQQAIAEALSHREAVGALGDALVLYTERVYAAYVDESAVDTERFSLVLREGATPELLARLQIMELNRQRLQLQAQHRAVAALRQAVDEMKATMLDLQSSLDRLSDKQRRQQIGKLAKQVRVLYQQIEPAFKE